MDNNSHAMFQETTERWDKLGMILSSLCALHCLLTPILVLSLPVLGEIFENEWVHILMALFVVPVGAFAFWSGFSHHRQLKVLVLGVFGLILVGGASVAPHSWLEFLGHELITICGSLCLLGGHILNRRACLCHRS